MSQASEDAEFAYAVLDSTTGELIASDETLRVWLRDRPISALLPQFNLDGLDKQFSAQTQILREGKASTYGTASIRPLLGKSTNTCLLVIQIDRSPRDVEFLDAVTGLPDRRALERQRRLWQHSPAGHVAHAILFIDLDDFKQVNDSHGHATGDQVLRVLAERWLKTLRAGDLLVRYGGDEFVVLLAGVRTEQEARPVVERLLQATSAPIVVGDKTLAVSATIGIAISESGTVELEALLAKADRAMYAAKRRIQ